MNIKYCFLFCFIVVVAGNYIKAQPVLTENNTVPRAGEIISSYALTNPGTYAEGDAGENVTWDFTNVQYDNTAVYIETKSASAAPGGVYFPGAQFAYTGTDQVQFFNSTATEYNFLGVYQPSTQAKIPYQDPEKRLSFPFTYQSSFLDSFKAEYTSGVPLVRSGAITVEADGYGTLKLPYATINNVLRMKIVQDYTDYMIEDGDTLIELPYYYEGYMWHTPGVHATLLALGVIYANGAQAYQGSMSTNETIKTSINDQDFMMNLNVYPNPASDRVLIDFSVQESCKPEFRLLNALGEIVQVQNIGEIASGFHRQQIKLREDIEPGIYFVQIQGVDGYSSNKIIIH